MSGILRVVLILISIVTYIYISRKLKRAQISTHDTIFWVLFAGILIFLSLFPGVIDRCSTIIGIYSSENFVFVLIIFILLMKVFLMNIKFSQLEKKFEDLVEVLSIKEKIATEQKNAEKTTEKIKEKIQNG